MKSALLRHEKTKKHSQIKFAKIINIQHQRNNESILVKIRKLIKSIPQID